MGANADLVASLYEAYDRRDFDAAFALLAPDVVLTAPNTDWPAAGRYHGHQGVREFWARMGVALVEQEMVRGEFQETGDTVTVPTKVNARRRRKDATLQGEFVDVWTVRDGFVVAADVYRVNQPAGEGSRSG